MSKTEDADFRYKFKVILVGEPGCGKTSLLNRYVDDKFNIKHIKTIGPEFKTQNVRIDNKTIKTELWDTAGEEKFACLIDAYFRQAVAAIIVYDITCRDTFKRAEFWLKQIKDRNDKPDEIQIMLVGNKVDLNNLRRVTTSDAKYFAEINSLLHVETSASSGTNVNEAFKELLEKTYCLKKFLGTLDPPKDPDIVDLNKPNIVKRLFSWLSVKITEMKCYL